MLLTATNAAVSGSLLLLAMIGGALALRHNRRAQARVLSAVANFPCPNCRRAYGADAPTTTTRIRYRWTAARDSASAELSLPSTTLLVACPHCVAEFEFTSDGRVFEQPRRGVLSYVRTGRIRNAEAGVS